MKLAQTIWFSLAALTCWSASAQEVVSDASPFPSESQVTPYNDSAVASRPVPFADASQQAAPFNWGPVSLRPHLLYRFLYGNGIQARAGQSEKTAIHEISPSLLFGIGTHWALDYTPTISLYSNRAFRDTLNHNVNFTGNASYNDWVFGLLQNYNLSSEPLVETGAQTERENFLTELDASYHFSDAMWTELGVSQNFRMAERFTSSREWSTLDWLNYQFVPGCFAGVGAGFGYVDMESGSDMTYEQLKAQIGWRATEKISLHLNVGGESRQFLDSGGDNVINPIFGASIAYNPFEVTTVSVSASRSVGASYFQDQVTETTSFQINLGQRLLGKLHLNAGFGYSESDFIFSNNGTSSVREDENFFVDTRLSCPIRARGTVAVFYHYSDNSSSQTAFGYSSSQVGLEIGYAY